MWKPLKYKLAGLFFSSRHIAPLITLRIVFGGLMLFSTVRFFWKGWINSLYIAPKFHFSFYGFEWVKPLGETGMYVLFAVMAISSLFILLGLFYRASALLFFLSFTYVELIDKTYYLNHYYFICLISFLMILVPAQRYFSLDANRNPGIRTSYVPAWTIMVFKLQLLIVYVFAGIAKITPEWLLEAMPLKIWLPANSHLPLIGGLLTQEWVAYVFSWIGMLFDLSIVFFLTNASTRSVAYFFVIVFHVVTAWFFKIGMFPFIMIGMTLLFFSESFHKRCIQKLQQLFRSEDPGEEEVIAPFVKPLHAKFVYGVLVVYFLLQVLVPLRYLLYPGELLWTEEGYRFSWRVMLMEKSGTAFFYVKDKSGALSEVNTKEFLTPFQEKMMSTQPDMILQFAHHLEAEYKKRGIQDPVITTDAYIRLNGRGSRLMIDNTVDLAKEKESLFPKKWILSYQSGSEK
jgi:hypothetical protein